MFPASKQKKFNLKDFFLSPPAQATAANSSNSTATMTTNATFTRLDSIEDCSDSQNELTAPPSMQLFQDYYYSASNQSDNHLPQNYHSAPNPRPACLPTLNFRINSKSLLSYPAIPTPHLSLTPAPATTTTHNPQPIVKEIVPSSRVNRTQMRHNTFDQMPKPLSNQSTINSELLKDWLIGKSNLRFEDLTQQISTKNNNSTQREHPSKEAIAPPPPSLTLEELHRSPNKMNRNIRSKRISQINPINSSEITQVNQSLLLLANPTTNLNHSSNGGQISCSIEITNRNPNTTTITAAPRSLQHIRIPPNLSFSTLSTNAPSPIEYQISNKENVSDSQTQYLRQKHLPLISNTLDPNKIPPSNSQPLTSAISSSAVREFLRINTEKHHRQSSLLFPVSTPTASIDTPNYSSNYESLNHTNLSQLNRLRRSRRHLTDTPTSLSKSVSYSSISSSPKSILKAAKQFQSKIPTIFSSSRKTVLFNEHVEQYVI